MADYDMLMALSQREKNSDQNYISQKAYESHGHWEYTGLLK
jgi:hypothetical protein